MKTTCPWRGLGGVISVIDLIYNSVRDKEKGEVLS